MGGTIHPKSTGDIGSTLIELLPLPYTKEKATAVEQRGLRRSDWDCVHQRYSRLGRCVGLALVA